MQRTYFLLGFMGSGKSYWGAKLADQLRLPFVDLDALIESGEGRSVATIFAEQGELVFRQLEQRYLKETVQYFPCIVATGGGTPCFFDNLSWMQQQGVTIYLQTPVSVLTARLREQRRYRPLLADVPEAALEAHIAELLHKREPFYLQAQIVAPYQEDRQPFFDQYVSPMRRR